MVAECGGRAADRRMGAPLPSAVTPSPSMAGGGTGWALVRLGANQGLVFQAADAGPQHRQVVQGPAVLGGGVAVALGSVLQRIG